jgi:hypothetical protein
LEQSYFIVRHMVRIDRSRAGFLNAVQPIQQRVDDAVSLAQQMANGELGNYVRFTA